MSGDSAAGYFGGEGLMTSAHFLFLEWMRVRREIRSFWMICSNAVSPWGSEESELRACEAVCKASDSDTMTEIWAENE